MAVRPGDVFRFYCHFPNEQKEKMMVLVKTKPYTFFMINSEISQYVLNKPHLLNCQVDIAYEDHQDFLSHDSVANCADKVNTNAVIQEKSLVFNAIEHHKVGRIADYVIRTITHNLETYNETLPPALKRDIIAALEAESE